MTTPTDHEGATMSEGKLSPEERADLELGLRQSAAGETVYLGSFERFAEPVEPEGQ